MKSTVVKKNKKRENKTQTKIRGKTPRNKAYHGYTELEYGC